MATKANWPEKMTALRVVESGDYVYKVFGEDEILASIYAVDKETLEHRTRYFRALPKMVEWMKDYHKKERWINQSDRDTVASILREIGEIE